MSCAALLCGIYLQAGIAAMQSSPAPAPPYSYLEYDVNTTRNPYGVVELGIEHEFSPRFSVAFSVRHGSSMQADDHGQNSAQLMARFYPWRTR